MSLSDKVEETFDKFKPNSEMAPLTESNIKESGSHFSMNLDELKDYLIVIICFVIALASVFLLVMPQFGQISEINSQFTVAQARLVEVQDQTNYLNGLVGLKDELESKISIADQVLPSTEDRVPYTMDQIIQVAEASGVSIESLSLSGIAEEDEAAADNVRSVLIQLKVTGTVETIQDFFYKLQNARTLVDITTFQLAQDVVTIESSTEGEEDLLIEQQSATLALKSYIKADAKTGAVDLSILANSPNYDSLFEKLRSMDFYETTPVEIEFGRDNPFDVQEATPSVGEFTPQEEIPEDESDSSGIE